MTSILTNDRILDASKYSQKKRRAFYAQKVKNLMEDQIRRKGIVLNAKSQNTAGCFKAAKDRVSDKMSRPLLINKSLVPKALKVAH